MGLRVRVRARHRLKDALKTSIVNAFFERKIDTEVPDTGLRLGLGLRVKG